MSDHAHAHHGPIDWPKDAQYGMATPGKLAMWIFLLSDAFSFSGLLLAYGILRGQSTKWIQPGEPELGIPFTAALTFWLICSSVTMVLAYAAAVEQKRNKMLLFLTLTVLGGIGFLGGQVKEYTGLVHEGLIFGHSHYATTFYVITGFHGLHVLSGTIYNAVTLWRAKKGSFDHGRVDGLEIAGLFWHFVDLVWILVFTFVYLIPEPVQEAAVKAAGHGG